MQIDIDLLITWGAVAKKYKKGEVIFDEGEFAHFYFQIITGSVKMYNINDEGREFTQGNFNSGDSFGEPPLFFRGKYPASACTIKDSVILKLQHESFLKILDEYPKIIKSFTELFACRLYNKSITAREFINPPELRIISFLNSAKERFGNNTSDRIKIPFTRQEIANFTGLRVETVIRTLSKMNEEHKVEIIKHKLYY